MPVRHENRLFIRRTTTLGSVEKLGKLPDATPFEDCLWGTGGHISVKITVFQQSPPGRPRDSRIRDSLSLEVSILDEVGQAMVRICPG